MYPRPGLSRCGALHGPSMCSALICWTPWSGSPQKIQNRPAWWRREGAHTPAVVARPGEVGGGLDTVQGVPDERPVDQVAGVQERQPGGPAEAGRGEVVVRADADYVRVGPVGVQHGVAVRAVPEVGGPGPVHEVTARRTYPAAAARSSLPSATTVTIRRTTPAPARHGQPFVRSEGGADARVLLRPHEPRIAPGLLARPGEDEGPAVPGEGEPVGGPAVHRLLARAAGGEHVRRRGLLGCAPEEAAVTGSGTAVGRRAADGEVVGRVVGEREGEVQRPGCG